MWHSGQSGRFRLQRSAVEIRKLDTFIGAIIKSIETKKKRWNWLLKNIVTYIFQSIINRLLFGQKGPGLAY